MGREPRRVLLAGLAAIALSAGAATADDQAVQEVTVTGTLIKAPNLTTASPVTVVGKDEIQYQGATEIENVLNRLPQFTADANENGSNGSDGTARVNLRHLGPSRTLVLVDGRRMLPQETADVNFIPSTLVDRVDVVTGGASAVYGSDAVAGVVNFIIRKNLDGVRADYQYGVAQHENGDDSLRSLSSAKGFSLAPSSVWDGVKRDANVAAGMNFDHDRGNVTVYIGRRTSQAVTQDRRDYSNCALNLSGNDALACGGSSNNSYGLFTLLSGPNSGETLVNSKDGSKSWVPYNSSYAYNYAPTNYIQRSDQRVTAGTFAHYEVAPEAELYGSFMMMDDRSFSQAAPSALFQGTTFSINCDNPLMSASQAATLCGSSAGTGATENTFIGYRLTGPGSEPRRDDLRHGDYRMNAGLKGDLDSAWSYDLNFLFSRMVLSEHYQNNVDNTKAQNALLVSNVNGVPTCQSVISGADPSCVPINAFQYNGISTAGYKYLYTGSNTHDTENEKVLSAGLTGQLGDYGIASPLAKDGVAVAFGAERRTESLTFEADAQAQDGGTMPNSGTLNVTELYGEMQIPLIQDRPWIKELSLDTGYRVSKYSSGEGWLSTYKLELQYAPTEDIRPRVSYNRAARAANISELYASQSLGNISGDDPCAGSSPTASLASCQRSGVTAAQYGHIPQCPADTCVTQNGGNPQLKPEVAKTYTIGAVLTPRILPALSMTVDYYDIKVDRYISSVDATTAINQCIGSGNSYFCGLFHRDPTVGVLFGNNGYIVATNQNTGYLATSGVDVSADYKLSLADLVGEGWGRLDFGLVGSVLMKQVTEPLPGLGTYDCKGLFGVTCGQPAPMWRHQVRATWSPSWVPGTLSLNWRYIGSVKNEADTGNPFLASDYVIVNKQIKAYNYFDLAVTTEFTKGITGRAGVNNIFDKDPPAIATSELGSFNNGNTYPGVYDALGRTLFVGLTAEF